MRVCLISPASLQDLTAGPQLGLAYLGAILLTKGHSVKIISRDVLMLMNKRNFQQVDELTVKALKDFQPQLVGIGAATSLINDAYRIAKLSKMVLPGVSVIVGGPHASVLPSQTLEECADIDLVVRGEGEYTIAELAEGRNLNEIEGITFRDDHKFYATKDRALIEDLDALPFPARNRLGMDFYLGSKAALLRGLDLRSTHILTMRGCPNSCSFCASSGIFKGRLRFHSVDYVVREVKHLISDYQIEGLYFAEDCFLADRKRAEALCREFIAEGINKSILWGTETTVDSVDEDILQLMKKAGCVQLEYGFESGSEKILEIMNKPGRLEDSLRAAKITKGVGLRIIANIIVGIPGETEEDLSRTKKFLRAIRPDYVSIYRFTPLPGSRLFEMLKKKDLINSNWDNFHVGDTKDPHLNFTQIKTERLFFLLEDLKLFVSPCNLRNYLIANLKFHPLRLLSKIWLRVLGHPASIFTYLGKLRQAFFSRL